MESRRQRSNLVTVCPFPGSDKNSAIVASYNAIVESMETRGESIATTYHLLDTSQYDSF